MQTTRVWDLPTRLFHWLLVLSFAGAYITSESERWRLLHVTLCYTLGALLVFGSAVSYAVYLVHSGQEVQRLGSLRLVGLATSVACVLCIAQFVILRPLDTAFAVAPEVLWLSLLNAIACTVVPVMLVMMAIERIGPGLTAQTGMIGPMSTLLMGVFILGEPFNMWIVGGTVLVLSGVFWVTRAPKV